MGETGEPCPWGSGGGGGRPSCDRWRRGVRWLVGESLGVAGKRFGGSGEDEAHQTRVLHRSGIPPAGKRQGWHGPVVFGSD
jgi:hypothetical protein